MGSGWGPTVTIRQTPTSLTVEYPFFARGDMQPPLSFKYSLDGAPSRNSVMMGRGTQSQTSTATWQADKVVITTTYPFVDASTGRMANAEVVQTLSLEAPGSLVVETLRRGVLGGPDSTARVVYKKAG
jgi:hypothetical protein